MSYMDRKNILSEGFFSALKNYIKDRKRMSKDEKKAFKSPKVRKAYANYKKAEKELYDDLEKIRKEMGLPPLDK